MLEILNINDLKLSLDNPRLTDSQNEQEEIEKMVTDQQKKLLKLAEDIIDHGLNPLDTIAVYPSIDDGKYVVAEGNRRITAVKILNNPELIRNINHSIYQGFKKLQLKYTIIETLLCFIFTGVDDPSLNHWIEIKHLGENEGKGTSSWSAIQKERFDKKKLGESKLLDFWENLSKLKILTSDEILEITKTNWDRILRDYGLEYLGIRKKQSSFIIPKDDLIEFTKKMREIHRQLRKNTVAVVYDQERIEKFYNSVNRSLYNRDYTPINKKTDTSVQLSLNIDNEIVTTNEDVHETNDSNNNSNLSNSNIITNQLNDTITENNSANNVTKTLRAVAPTTPLMPVESRLTIISQKQKLELNSTGNASIDRVALELSLLKISKAHINEIDGFLIAGTLLLRTFLQYCFEWYCNNNKITQANGLEDTIKNVTEKMCNDNLISKEQKGTIKTLLKNINVINILNDTVHNYNSNINKTLLFDFYDSIHPVVKHIYKDNSGQ